jgi:hypothetical protein
MKTIHKWASLALFLIAAACAGTTARTEVMLPAMRQAWAGIRPAVERYVSTVDDIAQRDALTAADAALQSGDPVAIAGVPWQLLDDAHEADVVRRVAASEIGPGVADSLRERLAKFVESRATFTRSN